MGDEDGKQSHFNYDTSTWNHQSHPDDLMNRRGKKQQRVNQSGKAGTNGNASVIVINKAERICYIYADSFGPHRLYDPTR